MTKLKLVVLMGGNSAEREVSLATGAEVVKNLDKEKYQIFPVDLKDGLDWMEKIKPELVFLALHGEGGEDGTIQRILDEKRIKYTGCGAKASELGMDKMAFRRKMEEIGVAIPGLTKTAPCVVKPVDRGSSVGVSIVKKQEDLVQAIEKAKRVSEKVMIEEYIGGTEVTCGVIGNGVVEAMPIVEICPKNEFFDYEAKYKEGFCEEIVPARISKELTEEIQVNSIKVFKAVGGRGYSRIDYIIRDGVPYVLEINTLPGLTPNSLMPKEAKAMGMSYSQLLDKIIELARE